MKRVYFEKNELFFCGSANWRKNDRIGSIFERRQGNLNSYKVAIQMT